jgi:hypothetical protein
MTLLLNGQIVDFRNVRREQDNLAVWWLAVQKPFSLEGSAPASPPTSSSVLNLDGVGFY